jgi:hypothetical protein
MSICTLAFFYRWNDVKMGKVLGGRCGEWESCGVGGLNAGTCIFASAPRRGVTDSVVLERQSLEGCLASSQEFRVLSAFWEDCDGGYPVVTGGRFSARVRG